MGVGRNNKSSFEFQKKNMDVERNIETGRSFRTSNETTSDSRIALSENQKLLAKEVQKENYEKA